MSKHVEVGKIKIGQVLDLAKSGRREILPTLQKALDDNPSLWKHYGNVALHAQGYWLELIAEKNLYFKEAASRHAKALFDELAGESATPLERLQAERIVALNLQLGYYESLLALHEASGLDHLLDYLHERCGVIDRRLQQALANFARIQRLLPKAIQVDAVVKKENASGGTRHNKQTQFSIPENRMKDLLTVSDN